MAPRGKSRDSAASVAEQVHCFTPLMWAAEQGHQAVLKLLLANGANLNAYSYGEDTALSLATRQGHEDIVKTLRDVAEVKFENTNGFTPLMRAAKWGYEAVLKLLLANGAEVNSYNDDNDTALSLAAQEGHGDIVKALLENGAEVNAYNDDNDTALSLATQGWHEDAVNTLLENGTLTCHSGRA